MLSCQRKLVSRSFSQYIGKTFNLCEPIQNGIGKIKIGDSVWLETGPELASGNKVQVTAMNGVYLEVKAADLLYINPFFNIFSIDE